MGPGHTGTLTAATLFVAGAGAFPQVPVSIPDGARSVRILRDGEPIRMRPDAASARRGAAAGDARLPPLEAVLGPGCATEWVRVADAAWLCMDEARWAADAPSRTVQPVVADDDLVPFRYAFAAYSGVPTYRRLDDVENDERAEDLERGMALAVAGTVRFEGRSYVRTAAGRFVAASDLHWARPSDRVGAAYSPGEAATGVGFATRRAFTYATAEGAAGVRFERPQGFVLPRAAIHVLDEQRIRARTVLRTADGWLLETGVRRVEIVPPPDGVRAAERWVDVDLGHQQLVAYEGSQPVYAALISTGTPAHPTRRGTFRVWIRLASADMANTDDESLEPGAPVYSVERVPWVMYFHDDQALHGAYWHDRFGSVHSHGCVNLAPRDARWLFTWAPPVLPPGWSAVLPTDTEPGMRVRVR